MSSEASTGWTSPARSHGPRALPARLRRPNSHPRWARGGSEAASKASEAQVTSWSRRRRKESLPLSILTRALRRPSEASDMAHVGGKPTSDTRSTRYSMSHPPHHGWRRRRRRPQDHQVGVIFTSRGRRGGLDPSRLYTRRSSAARDITTTSLWPPATIAHTPAASAAL